jgi:dTDP-4-dehydrorhamnose reductase
MSRPPPRTFLVIGSDGLLGRQLFTSLTQAGESVWGTSRREDSVASRVIRLDLEDDPAQISLPRPADVVFFCSAVTGMEYCEANPASTRCVNVTHSLRIAEKLLDEGSFLQFLSTNAVFDGTQSYPGEHMPASPSTEYGRQKAEVEARLLELDRGHGQVAISRMTKVLSPTLPVIRRFREGLAQEEHIEAFFDLRLSPVSLDYAVSSLLAVARRREGGIFHFSGDDELSYSELARELAARLDVSESLVMPVAASERGVVPVFRPAHPALGMARTREVLGVSPQPLDQVITELVTVPGTSPVS